MCVSTFREVSFAFWGLSFLGVLKFSYCNGILSFFSNIEVVLPKIVLLLYLYEL